MSTRSTTSVALRLAIGLTALALLAVGCSDESADTEAEAEAADDPTTTTEAPPTIQGRWRATITESEQNGRPDPASVGEERTFRFVLGPCPQGPPAARRKPGTTPSDWPLTWSSSGDGECVGRTTVETGTWLIRDLALLATGEGSYEVSFEQVARCPNSPDGMAINAVSTWVYRFRQSADSLDIRSGFDFGMEPVEVPGLCEVAGDSINRALLVLEADRVS